MVTYFSVCFLPAFFFRYVAAKSKHLAKERQAMEILLGYYVHSVQFTLAILNVAVVPMEIERCGSQSPLPISEPLIEYL